MTSQDLERYNESLLMTYQPNRFENSVNCVMPGYFSGHDVLFIAQNPGELKETVEGDVLYIDAFKKNDFHLLNDYYVQALKSSRGTYGTFINDVYGEDWTRISLTNVFKCPFNNNTVPVEIPDKELKILSQQLDLLNPVIIFTVGSYAKKAIDKINPEIARMHGQHPSFLKRSGKYEREVLKYKDELLELLTLM